MTLTVLYSPLQVFFLFNGCERADVFVLLKGKTKETQTGVCKTLCPNICLSPNMAEFAVS